MTAIPNGQQRDIPREIALQAYLDRDAETLRQLAKANPSHPWVQIEAAHLAADLYQPKVVMHYLGAAAKADLKECWKSWYYWHLLGGALTQLGDQGEGEAAAKMAIKISPHQALLWVQYGTYAFHRGDHQEGHARFQKALECPERDPEDAKAVGETLLFLGRFKEGWKKWEARTKLRSIVGRHKFSVPKWSGERLTGKRIVVWAEQGAGDQIQFLRFLPLLKERNCHITLRVMASLNEWASELLERGHVDELGADGDIKGELDYHVPLLSLPHVMGRPNPNDWPEPWAPKIPLTPIPGKVGYCWRGNPEHGNDHDRSHYERAEFEWALGKTDQWVNLTGGDEDSPKGWMTTAKEIATCEKVVTVDTAICHVAGSLGVPTITVLAAAPEWRWARTYHDKTPWYPSMTLVRKRNVGDWHTPLAEARQLLEGK